MDSAVVTMLGVGVGLAALIVSVQRSLRTEIGAVGTRLGKRFDGLEARVGKIEDRMSGLEGRMGALDARLSHLEGVLSVVLTPLRPMPLSEPAPDESSG